MIPTDLAILGWVPLSAVLFAVLSPVRAVTLAYLVGWLLLPVGNMEISGFWDIDKIMATNFGVIAGTLLFCPREIRAYKIHVADILLLAFCFGGFISSITNSLGMYDGASRFTYTLFRYGAPFLAGRVFLRNGQQFYEAVRMIVIGAALYAIPTLWEWKMSPQLHNFVYGTFQHSWQQHYRWGFWRPIAFFPHALALGTFFAWTSLLAVWLYRRKYLQRSFGFWSWLLVAGPVAGLVSSMSFGPWGLFIGGSGMMLAWDRLHWKSIMLAPVCFAVIWMGLRYTGFSDGEWLSSAVAKISESRASSLDYRIEAETLLIDKAKRRPYFGWGTWGRNRVKNEAGRDQVATDGKWVILLGTGGLFGLTAFFLWWCWPVLMHYSIQHNALEDPALLAFIVSIGLQAAGFLFNGFLSPILTLMCGSTITLLHMIYATSKSRAANRPVGRLAPAATVSIR
jgi:hypothetical protein